MGKVFGFFQKKILRILWFSERRGEGVTPSGVGGLLKKCCRIVALTLKFVQYCTLLLIVHHIDIPAVFYCQLLWNIGVT